MNHKKWIRLVCTVLALLLFVTGSGVSFAMAEQPDKETVLTEEQAATPETAESARLSLTVLDSDYSGSENGNIDESLFNTETDHAEIAAGKIVPLLLQVDGPAQGSSVTVKLDKSAQFCDPRGQELSGQEWKRTFQQESQSAWMLYVTSGADFTVTAIYEDQSGNRVTRAADIARKAAPTLFRAAQARSTTQYHITDVSKVGGEWLITFEGENESYCMDEGLSGRPTSSVYWTYYGTTDLLDKAAAAGCTSKLDVQRYVWAHRGEASDSGSAYVYAASEPGWQNVVTRYAPPDLPTEPGEPEEPEQPEEYYASWEAPSQSAGGSFDMKFTVNTDKVGLDTGEKVDGAKITITPTKTSGSVDGGSWQMSPAGAQTITTSGHTNDDSYQNNGGDGTVTWSVHYEVSKTSTSTLSGQVGPFGSQDEADAAAEEAKNAAVSQLQNEAQGMVDAAIAAARAELASIRFSYDEVEIPYGFEEFNGSLGSHQTITVPADSSNDYIMKNDEWSLQINLKKVDSETGQQIAADAAYKVYEWDTVTQKYIPYGGYNQYTVIRNEDGTYSVANGSAYASGDPIKSRTMYYTQRNEGRFLIVETRAPSGYYGDWTDAKHPGTAGTPLGKRAYSIVITQDNDGSVIWLDNEDYNADIAFEYTGGTKLLTSGGVETTVTISDEKKDATRVYKTDSTGLANNEDSYTMTPKDGNFQNDRVLGEIILTKSDLDQLRQNTPRSASSSAVSGTAPHGEASIEGAVYDLYAAADILHPDGVTGVVDYSKIVDSSGKPIWHTTVRTNSGWDESYLPILAKDHLVASAEIKDGKLVFGNLYLGRYYLVERATGIVLPVDTNSKFYITGQYPELNRELEPTGQYSPLEQSDGEYTDYIYKNLYSAVAEGRALDGSKTYDGYYLSYAEGYLCDEVNHYQTLSYGDESGYVIRESEHSLDAVLKGGFELRKLVSTTGPGSPAPKLEGAGFTIYRIPDLSKADQFTRNPDGSYNIQSVLDAYRKDNYDNETLKYDFSQESQAVARMFESDTDLVYVYNATLTEAGDNANGSGLGWVPTGTTNEYRLEEIFTNEEGVFRVTGLPYGQYLVVESTIPKDVFQCDPFGFTVDSTTPQSVMCQPNGSATEPSNSYLTYNILDEEMEGYLKLIKVDAETGKAVKLANTSFAIYMLHEDGTKERLSMVDPSSGDPTEKTNVFYTDSEGRMKTPEKLPLGRYEVVELEGPNGFFNDEQYSVEFEISSDSAWEVIGNAVNDMDEYILTQEYINHETLGRLTIRKTGPVLTGWEEENSDLIDPQYSGEAWPGHFVYEDRPIPYAEYTITANEDIYTQDHQVDADGNRTLWYAKGDVVAVVQTGDGTSDIVTFAPGRTNSTYDFLSIIHDGTVGEVTVTLPLGSYHIEETSAPYGYVGTKQSYDVVFSWDVQTNSVVMAQSITSTDEEGNASTDTFEVVNADEATAEQAEAQVLKFYNERVKTEFTVCKRDVKTDALVAGAVYNLYTVDDIYNGSGELLFHAGDLIATSAPTDSEGRTTFTCDLPLRGLYYGMSNVQIPENTTANSGRYLLRELRAPEGYYLDAPDQELAFIYAGSSMPVVKLEQTFKNDATSFFISKQKLTGDEELPGATLTIQDEDGTVVRQWVSGDKPTEIRGLKFDTVYTLVETAAPNGYEVAESIKFKLQQRKDENGDLLNENDVYICTGRDWLIFDHWTLMADGMVVMRDAPTPETPPTPNNPAPTPTPEQPVSTPAPTPAPSVPVLPQTGDIPWLPAVLFGTGVAAAMGLGLTRKKKHTGGQDSQSKEK
ncbi:LPXTG cell wall anchor domain-containing protein [Gemmiger formicilis]|uniref:SpaA isopeptide-forming pilin-related protein n=1 Tax=Gemmiger formicilis TaxID=745368 RepID=UPI00195DBC9A|nr:SpaA isopeptide-forming pilin-related protein [Gemmiger formicilis]MBM6715872.1 LPXTG cell wall anchor domain-containing protein [Gemmiger formicilis]